MQPSDFSVQTWVLPVQAGPFFILPEVSSVQPRGSCHADVRSICAIQDYSLQAVFSSPLPVASSVQTRPPAVQPTPRFYPCNLGLLLSNPGFLSFVNRVCIRKLSDMYRVLRIEQTSIPPQKKML